MKRLLLAALFALQASLAWAGCNVGALPFVLQNGTVADATQVDANFNQIVTGAAAGCAAAGANSDITSLGGLTTPLSPAQGGSPVFTGVAGRTTGTANAQAITVNSNFSLTNGYHVTGMWGTTNTATMTISVNGAAAVSIWRKQQFGISPTQGGEAVVGHSFDLIYYAPGGFFILNGDIVHIGELKMVTYNAAASPPPGWLVADGSSFVCATLTDLCTVIGTSYGGTASNPLLPDTRGRVMAGLDSYGTAVGSANRLTASGGCGSGMFFVGQGCANGSQSHTQILAEIAAHNHVATDLGHGHTTTLNSGAGGGTGTGIIMDVSTGGTNTNPGAGANSRLDGTVSVNTGNANITVTNTGSGQAMPIVNPNLGTVMIIRF